MEDTRLFLTVSSAYKMITPQIVHNYPTSDGQINNPLIFQDRQPSWTSLIPRLSWNSLTFPGIPGKWPPRVHDSIPQDTSKLQYFHCCVHWQSTAFITVQFPTLISTANPVLCSCYFAMVFLQHIKQITYR